MAAMQSLPGTIDRLLKLICFSEKKVEIPSPHPDYYLFSLVQVLFMNADDSNQPENPDPIIQGLPETHKGRLNELVLSIKHNDLILLCIL